MKKLKSMIITALIMMNMTQVVSAYDVNYENSVNNLENALIQMHIPEMYYGNIYEYLQRLNITLEQQQQILDKFNQANQIIGDQTNLWLLPLEDKIQLHSLAVKAGNVLGLRFQSDNITEEFVTSIAATTPKGGTLFKVDTYDVIELVLNYDKKVVENVIKYACDYSRVSSEQTKPEGDGDGDSGFIPEGGGNLNDTATPYGNLMLAGTSMIAMAGTIHIVSKKKNK